MSLDTCFQAHNFWIRRYMAEDETSWILLEQLIILSPQSPQQQTKLHLRIYVLLLLLEHVAVMLILKLIELLGLVIWPKFYYLPLACWFAANRGRGSEGGGGKLHTHFLMGQLLRSLVLTWAYSDLQTFCRPLAKDLNKLLCASCYKRMYNLKRYTSSHS